MLCKRFSEFVLRVPTAEEMLAAFPAVSVLNNSYVIIKVNLNRLLCFHYVVLSIRAWCYLFHSVRICSENHLRMDHLASELLVALPNSFQSHSFQDRFHWPLHNLFKDFLDRSCHRSKHVFLKLVENSAKVDPVTKQVIYNP